MDTQEETLQPESLEIEDTSLKMINHTNEQNLGSHQTQENTENDSQNMTPQIGRKKMMKSRRTRLQEHHKMPIIRLLLMTMTLMMLMTQYSSAIQLKNHFCQEVSASPLLR